MTHKQFFISDTHFGHSNILNFKDSEGKPLRTFSCAEEMDEHMADCWNSVVQDQDTVYHLGDVVINRRFLPIMDRLKGRKVLVKGNHDIFKLRDYVKYFDDIRAYKIFPEYRIICSHIPIHPSSLERWKLNIHGHLHSNALPDPKYFNVSVERINYTPISLEEIIKLKVDVLNTVQV